MKYKFLLISLLIFVVACSSSELPPEPTPLENSNGITGNAILDYTDLGWAPPVDVFDNNKQLVFANPNPLNFKIGQEQATLNVEVTQEGGLVYNKGYVMLKDNRFVPITFNGEQLQNSKWLSETGTTTYNINKKDAETGTNFVVAYTCKLQNNEWKCGCTTETECGNWILQDYTVNKNLLPPNPEEIQEPNLNNTTDLENGTIIREDFGLNITYNQTTENNETYNNPENNQTETNNTTQTINETNSTSNNSS